jgi:hypothetical protein
MYERINDIFSQSFSLSFLGDHLVVHVFYVSELIKHGLPVRVLFCEPGLEGFDLSDHVKFLFIGIGLVLSVNQVLARLLRETVLSLEPSFSFFSEVIEVGFVLLVGAAPEKEPVREDFDIHGNLIEHFNVECLVVLLNGAVDIGEDRHS